MTEPRYTIVTSDHHWGDGSAADVFDVGTRRKRYGKFLDYVEDLKAQYIIAGDLGDCLIANGPQILWHYHKEFQRLAAMKAVFVAGNHDAQWGGPRWAQPAHSFFNHARFPCCTQTIAERYFVVCHGNQFDRYCDKPYPDLDAITALLTARRARRRGKARNGERPYTDLSPGIVGRIGSFGRWLIGKPSRLNETIAKAEESRQNIGNCVIVYGHTHVAGRIGDCHYNSGTLIGEEGSETLVQIDHETGEVKLFRWSMECEAVEFDTELRAA